MTSSNQRRKQLLLAALCLALCTVSSTTEAQVLQSQKPALKKPSVPLPPQNSDPALLAQDDSSPVPLEAGPIHEAFADPVSLDSQASIHTTRKPPEPVNEVPPDVLPEGKNVHWVHGYWMWSDVQDDFVWVSGVYRDFPPNRRWVPGYWTAEGAGYVWISGFWAPASTDELAYLPHPPESLDLGPTSEAPGENQFWVPGCWTWRDTGYRWRPGYWNVGYDDWVWIPSRYCYTPRGSIYVSGYWDRYPLYRRGLLYAPVYWRNAYYARPGYYYRPYSVINTGLLIANLFVHNNHRHYYYGPRGWRYKGYYPWYDVRAARFRGHRYDPLVAHSRWRYGHNARDWDQRVAKHFRNTPGDHRDGSPGGRQNSRPGPNRPGGKGTNDRLVRRAKDLERDGGLPGKYHRSTESERQRERTRAQASRQLADGRTKFERREREEVNRGRTTQGDRGHTRAAQQARNIDSSRERRAAFKVPIDKNATTRRPSSASRDIGANPSRTRDRNLGQTNSRSRPNTDPLRSLGRQSTGVSRSAQSSRTRPDRPKSTASSRQQNTFRSQSPSGFNSRTRPDTRSNGRSLSRGSSIQPPSRNRSTAPTRKSTPSTRSAPTRTRSPSTRSAPTRTRAPSTRSAPTRTRSPSSRSRPPQTRSRPSAARRAPSQARSSGGNRGSQPQRRQSRKP